MNKVLLIGNLGKDVELITSQQGLSIAAFTLATKRKLKSGEETTQWHNCTAFGKTADSIASALKKGSYVMLDAEIQYSSYEKDGSKRVSTKIVVNNIAMMLQDKPNDTYTTKPIEVKSSSRPVDQMGSYDLEEDLPF